MFQNVLEPLGMTNSFFTQPPPDDKKNRTCFSLSFKWGKSKRKIPYLSGTSSGRTMD
ncbi:MAG: beta-lactamase family protein [Bacteroidales bacterium]|nr:beta-lactamase family protein [Bacteroidales bacterium]